MTAPFQDTVPVDHRPTAPSVDIPNETQARSPRPEGQQVLDQQIEVWTWWANTLRKLLGAIWTGGAVVVAAAWPRLAWILRPAARIGRHGRAVGLSPALIVTALVQSINRLGRVLALGVVAAIALPFVLLSGAFNSVGFEASLVALLFFGAGGAALFLFGWAFVPLLICHPYVGTALSVLWVTLGLVLRLLGHEEFAGGWAAAWGIVSTVALIGYCAQWPGAVSRRHVGTVVFVVLSCAVVGLLRVPAFRDLEPSILAQIRSASARAQEVCQERFGDSSTAPFEGRGLADGTGLMSADALAHLLLQRRIRHVDFQVAAYVKHGRMTLSGDAVRSGESDFVTDVADGWLRVSLGASGQANCWPSGASLIRLPGGPPILPNTCVTVTHLARTDADLQLQWRKPASADEFGQLTLTRGPASPLLDLPTGARLPTSAVQEVRDMTPETCGRDPFTALLGVMQGPAYAADDGSRLLNTREVLVTPLAATTGSSSEELREVVGRYQRRLVPVHQWEPPPDPAYGRDWSSRWAMARAQGEARCDEACLVRMQGFLQTQYKLGSRSDGVDSRSTRLWADTHGVWQISRLLQRKDEPDLIARHDHEGRLLSVVKLRLPDELRRGTDPISIAWVQAESDTLVLTLREDFVPQEGIWQQMRIEVPLAALHSAPQMARIPPAHRP